MCLRDVDIPHVQVGSWRAIPEGGVRQTRRQASATTREHNRADATTPRCAATKHGAHARRTGAFARCNVPPTRAGVRCRYARRHRCLECRAVARRRRGHAACGDATRVRCVNGGALRAYAIGAARLLHCWPEPGITYGKYRTLSPRSLGTAGFPTASGLGPPASARSRTCLVAQHRACRAALHWVIPAPPCNAAACVVRGTDERGAARGGAH
jgi:hypothetical protein